MRFPTVAADRLAFVHADQIWVAPKSGGKAEKLTDQPGTKSCLHFSGDGKTLAYSSDAEGNESIYVIDMADRKPFRVTHHPYGAQLCGWTPDRKLLFMSAMSVANWQGDWRQLFTVSPKGGLPTPIPLTQASDGAVSPDGKLIAFTEYANRFLPWKHNYGGLASDLWLFDQAAHKARKITDWKGTDTLPMWHGNRLFFLSDAGPEQRLNLWEIEPNTGRRKQWTRFADFDIDDPCIGPDEIVFQKAGSLFRFEIPTGKCARIDVSTPEEATTNKMDASDAIVSATPLDSGGIVVEAGGDIWLTDAEGANPRNLTDRDPADRFPAVSPDGSLLAYVTDAGGEYNLAIRNLEGGQPKEITHRSNGFLGRPVWSPDSLKVAFSDNAGRLYVYFRSTGQVIEADRDDWNRGLHLTWSPDSQFLGYAKTELSSLQSLWLYDVSARRTIRLTEGLTKDDWPCFDRQGDYLFFTSNRDYRRRTFDSFDFDNFVYPVSGALLAMPLRRGTAMPWAPRPAGLSAAGLDFEDIERRATMMTSSPLAATDLKSTARSNLLYIDRTNGDGVLKVADFDQMRTTRRLERTLLPGVDSYEISQNGSKLLTRRQEGFALLDLDSSDPHERILHFKGLTKTVDKHRAWRRMFEDGWRFCRDYVYDKSLNGVDWKGVRAKYGPLIDGCSTRSEMDYLLFHMLGELHMSHCSLESGAVMPHIEENTGTLGVDFEVANGAYRIKKIYDSAAWDTMARSILRRPGLSVKEGDYLLAVNGKAVDATQDPWLALRGTAQTPTRLTIGPNPVKDALAKDVPVAPYTDDTYVRGRAWMEANRQYVAKRSGGRVGYVFVPDVFNYGADALTRQFYGQFDKDALIIDDRWNGGGRNPDRFIEILQRKPFAYGVRQNTLTGATPSFAHAGPQCMLINGASKSGGDSLPLMFQQLKLGKLIGTPTMGARGGFGGPEPPPFVDGTRIFVPHVSSVDASGKWWLDDRGVQPDVRVLPDPAGADTQLDAAIDLMLRQLPPAKRPRHRRDDDMLF